MFLKKLPKWRKSVQSYYVKIFGSSNLTFTRLGWKWNKNPVVGTLMTLFLCLYVLRLKLYATFFPRRKCIMHVGACRSCSRYCADTYCYVFNNCFFWRKLLGFSKQKIIELTIICDMRHRVIGISTDSCNETSVLEIFWWRIVYHRKCESIRSLDLIEVGSKLWFSSEQMLVRLTHDPILYTSTVNKTYRSLELRREGRYNCLF